MTEIPRTDVTSTRPAFARPISATERLYLSGRPLAAPFAIQLVVTGVGDLDPADLTAAVARGAEACPGARLHRDGDRWVDSGIAPRVTVIENAAIDFDALDADPVLARDFAGDATTEVVLLRTADRASATVVFRAFHGVMDARGLGLWVADVFRVLRGQDPIGAPDTTADHDLVAALGVQGKPTTLMPVYRSPIGGSGRVPRDRPFLLAHRQVDAAPAGVVARISAAFADATETAIRVMIPVDLRRHDASVRSTANLALPLFLDVEPGRTWSQVHAQVLTAMTQRRELAEMDNGGLAKLPGPVTRGVLRALHRIGARTDRNMVSALVSHAGKVSSADLSAPGFAADGACALPVHTGLVPVSFVMLEFDGVTRIVVSARAGTGVAERLDGLLDRASSVLTAAEADEVALVPALSGGPAPAAAETADSRFRAHAVATPNAVAVSGPEGELTYRELDLRVDAVAAALRAEGIGSGHIVAILAGRTPAAVAGQLGINRAGAAFLALDPNHPAERLAAILTDSGTALLLADGPRLGVLDTEVPELALDSITPDSVESAVTQQSPVQPDDLVYLTYTSGSTGRPKGVMVTHGGIVAFVDGVADWYRFGPDTRFAYHHTQAADMACAALFAPLLSGGAIVLVPDEPSHLTLRAMFEDSGANTYLITPSLLDVAMRLDIAPSPTRAVLIGGEQVTAAIAARARRFFGPETRLVNSYGPAEVTVSCTSHVIEDEADLAEGSVPIGVPTAGTDVYLLDDRRRPVQAGAVGELWFSGSQVARGYLGRPDLTAERFAEVAEGVRAYRTGDLARVLPSGALEFTGRVDGQVKVRGNRVEPEEVRAALESLDGIVRAAVVGRRGRGGGTVLAAYVITDDPAMPLDESAIRSELGRRLPRYMVPSVIRSVGELPRTANGKLDVSLLPELDETEIASVGGEQRPAGDDTFGIIAGIWAGALAVEVGELTEDSDFLILGGDSLASLEMLAAVSKTVVGASGEARFVARLEGLVQQMTLGRVLEAAVAARDGG